MGNPLVDVQRFGQSIWYDNIRRGLIASGELKELIDKDGLLGVTSNPAIFEKALAGSTDYDQATAALVKQGSGGGKEINAKDIYEKLAIDDIQHGADVMLPVYKQTAGRDGYVSFEVSPYLAHDTKGTLEEARRLHKAIARPNVMIKVPATPEGIPAVEQLIGEGINVNVTLLFAVENYAAVARAYLAGLKKLSAAGGDLSKVASVASFFISRIDSLIDDKLERELDTTRDDNRRKQLKGLVGKVAIANAKVAYAHFLETTSSTDWKALAAKGARPQRLLWASTGTKNPKYSPTLYVDELIGADTVNTIPAETYVAFRTSGKVRESLTENWSENLEAAKETMVALAAAGISMREATDYLQADGVQKFSEAFDKLLAAVEKKRQQLLEGKLARQTYQIGKAQDAVKAVLDQWRAQGNVRRLWNGDATLWSSTDEGQWLGWLHITSQQLGDTAHFRQVVDTVKSGGFKHALLLGMGGSSLCPEVLVKTFGAQPGFPQFHVLDSTVPAQVKAFEKKIDLKSTVFIVSSKSGGTIEPNVFKQYFLDKVKQAVGAEHAGGRFIAITDPGTKMHQIAKDDRFRHIFFGVPTIGGRFSALSNFGMVPAAVMGINATEFLDSAEAMVQSCASCVPPEVNPGVVLGVILGTLAKQGRDKVTIIASPKIGGIGSWLEQLIAESTGKEGKGLVPVGEEELGPPSVYGQDRLFAYVRLTPQPSAEQDAGIDALAAAGHPVVRIALDSPMEIGQEFFRWEIATAVAGSILGINTFNQPDVEAAKIAARKLTAAFEETGKMPPESPTLSGEGITLFTDGRNADALQSSAKVRTVAGLIAAHLARIVPGDYFAINAYVEMNEAHAQILQSIRHAVRDSKRVATTLGFGPRFLHSTGQLHKGGPNTGVFLQVTSDDAEDLPIPGNKFTFGLLKRCQAQGDFEVLAERGRRILRVHLGPDVRAGLTKLRDLVQAGLKGA